MTMRPTRRQRDQEHEREVQRLIAQSSGYGHRVAELEGQLARTQEWLEKFQGVAAANELEVHRLEGALGEALAVAREVRALLVEADSNLGLVVYRYPRSGVPDDLLDDMKDLRRRIHPYVAARGRGATGDTAVSNAVDESLAGSNPAAPTGAVQVSPCPLCGERPNHVRQRGVVPGLWRDDPTGRRVDSTHRGRGYQVVAGSRGSLYMRRRAEILRTWPGCPECNPLGLPDEGDWTCQTCTGMGRVPPRPPRTAVGTAEGDERPCAACPVGILPKGWVVEEDGREYHPGCLAKQKWTRACE